HAYRLRLSRSPVEELVTKRPKCYEPRRTHPRQQRRKRALSKRPKVKSRSCFGPKSHCSLQRKRESFPKITRCFCSFLKHCARRVQVLQRVLFFLQSVVVAPNRCAGDHAIKPLDKK